MTTLARCLVATILATLLFVCATALLRHGLYGWTLFFLIPILLGGLSTLAFRPATAAAAAGKGAATVTVSSFLLLLFRLDGIVCIGMALPLVVPLGALGGWLFYLAKSPRTVARSSMMFLLLTPATLTWDVTAQPRMYEVRTEITIAASPEQVWKHVIASSTLPEPREWLFRAGVGYPQRAHIEGSGPSATRYCDFSTGALVEPVEIWDEPRLLRFRVTNNPVPLHEWTPYGEIETKHLHGYLISKQGEFLLTRLADGNTLLRATTWYQHGLWPAEYWRWWSDAIIHRIHLRVLNNIRARTERVGSVHGED